MTMLDRWWQDDGGQDVIEYALIAGLVSVVAYALIQGAGLSVMSVWTAINSDIAVAT